MAGNAPKVHFDVWWALTEEKIPKQHLKEIIRADFKGRGLSHMETMASYTAALKAYGVTI
jgi:hypothetical protein